MRACVWFVVSGVVVLSSCLVVLIGADHYALGLCVVCADSTINDPDRVVCCDTEGCPREFHFGCLTPPITHIRQLGKGDWHCPTCLKNMGLAADEAGASEAEGGVTDAPAAAANPVDVLMADGGEAEPVAARPQYPPSHAALVSREAATLALEDAARRGAPGPPPAYPFSFAFHRPAPPPLPASAPSGDGLDPSVEAPFWWQHGPTSSFLLPPNLSPPMEFLRLQRLPGPGPRLSLPALLELLGLGDFVPALTETALQTRDLLHLSEADFARWIPPLGPRRRLQAYVRAHLPQFSALASAPSAVAPSVDVPVAAAAAAAASS